MGSSSLLLTTKRLHHFHFVSVYIQPIVNTKLTVNLLQYSIFQSMVQATLYANTVFESCIKYLLKEMNIEKICTKCHRRLSSDTTVLQKQGEQVV